MKRNILILFGGKSTEHDISIVSTFQCLKYFDEFLYNIILVYIDHDGGWKLVNKNESFELFVKNRGRYKNVQLGIDDRILYIKNKTKFKKYCDVDIVFPILHGINGEDGCIAGLLKMSNIAFVGCDNLSSSVGIDKINFKRVCSALPMLKHFVVKETDLVDYEKIEEKISNQIGFPCIIKPSKLGSSIGINICDNKEKLGELIKKSLIYDKKLVIEEYVSNMREFNIALFDCEGELILSDIEEPILNDKILSFDDKYLNFSEQNESKKLPANIGLKLKKQIENYAKECYEMVGCSGICRVDFIYDKKNKKLYINEINTIPGSLALYLFESSGVDRKTVLNKVIHESIRKFYGEKDTEILYKSAVLNSKNISKFNK